MSQGKEAVGSMQPESANLLSHTSCSTWKCASMIHLHSRHALAAPTSTTTPGKTISSLLLSQLCAVCLQLLRRKTLLLRPSPTTTYATCYYNCPVRLSRATTNDVSVTVRHFHQTCVQLAIVVLLVYVHTATVMPTCRLSSERSYIMLTGWDRL